MKQISKKVLISSIVVCLLLGWLVLPMDYSTTYGASKGITSSLFLWGGFLIIYGNYQSKGKRYRYLLGAILVLMFLANLAQ